jgi:hypothetical protein
MKSLARVRCLCRLAAPRAAVELARPALRAPVRIGLGVFVSLWLALPGAWGAELRGRITLANGQPAGNEAIRLNGQEVGRTDGAGVYVLNLSAGAHTLTVRGQPIQVQVSPNGSRRDIQVK